MTTAQGDVGLILILYDLCSLAKDRLCSTYLEFWPLYYSQPVLAQLVTDVMKPTLVSMRQ